MSSWRWGGMFNSSLAHNAKAPGFGIPGLGPFASPGGVSQEALTPLWPQLASKSAFSARIRAS